MYSFCMYGDIANVRHKNLTKASSRSGFKLLSLRSNNLKHARCCWRYEIMKSIIFLSVFMLASCSNIPRSVIPVSDIDFDVENAWGCGYMGYLGAESLDKNWLLLVHFKEHRSGVFEAKSNIELHDLSNVVDKSWAISMHQGNDLMSEDAEGGIEYLAQSGQYTIDLKSENHHSSLYVKRGTVMLNNVSFTMSSGQTINIKALKLHRSCFQDCLGG